MSSLAVLIICSTCGICSNVFFFIIYVTFNYSCSFCLSDSLLSYSQLCYLFKTTIIWQSGASETNSGRWGPAICFNKPIYLWPYVVDLFFFLFFFFYYVLDKWSRKQKIHCQVILQIKVLNYHSLLILCLSESSYVCFVFTIFIDFSCT